MKTKVIMLLSGLGLLFTLGCTKYPPSSDRLLEDMVVLTQYDVKVDFNQFKTYDIEQTVVKISDKDTTVISNDATDAVFDQINSDMQARGFEKPATGVSPDLRITLVYYENTYVYQYSYYDWYYPYYGYGWYYPYYPTYYSSYTAGIANINLIDMKNVAPGNTLYLRWNAGIRGLLTDQHTTEDIRNAVHQAFVQTPQLTTSGK